MEIITTGGLAMPKLGLGTWGMTGAECRAAVESALELGYRHIDTAQMYGNADAIGAALQASQVPRSDLHITTKVWWTDLSPPAMRRAMEQSLAALRTDYVDLYLIHWPAPNMDLPRALETLMALRQEGKTKQIGVSNFTVGCSAARWRRWARRSSAIRSSIMCCSIRVRCCPMHGRRDWSSRRTRRCQGAARRSSGARGDRAKARGHARASRAEMAAPSGRRRRNSESRPTREPAGQSRCAALTTRRRGPCCYRASAEGPALRQSDICAGVGFLIRAGKLTLRKANARPICLAMRPCDNLNDVYGHWQARNDCVGHYGHSSRHRSSLRAGAFGRSDRAQQVLARQRGAPLLCRRGAAVPSRSRRASRPCGRGRWSIIRCWSRRLNGSPNQIDYRPLDTTGVLRSLGIVMGTSPGRHRRHPKAARASADAPLSPTAGNHRNSLAG